MTLTDCMVYSIVAAGIMMWIVCFAVVERHKLAGLPAAVWVALRALVWAALVAIWFSVLAAILAYLSTASLAGTTAGGQGGPSAEVFGDFLAGGGLVITICVAIALTVLGLYMYSSLWQLGAIQPHFTRRRSE
jgi:hypothetical protein